MSNTHKKINVDPEKFIFYQVNTIYILKLFRLISELCSSGKWQDLEV